MPADQSPLGNEKWKMRNDHPISSKSLAVGECLPSRD
jgi:hypothetical protein